MCLGSLYVDDWWNVLFIFFILYSFKVLAHSTCLFYFFICPPDSIRKTLSQMSICLSVCVSDDNSPSPEKYLDVTMRGSREEQHTVLVHDLFYYFHQISHQSLAALLLEVIWLAWYRLNVIHLRFSRCDSQ